LDAEKSWAIMNQTKQVYRPQDATHRVHCRHSTGSRIQNYTMPCLILKDMPDGIRTKIVVFGDRFWTDSNRVKVRYVDKANLEAL